METKKVLGIIFSILFICAFGFVLSWGIINFNKVKDGMSGTGVYTKDDVDKAYKDGYSTALDNEKSYTELIDSYRDTITAQTDQISELNSQVTLLTNSNKDYTQQISKLENHKVSLEEQVDNLTTIKTNNETTIASLQSQVITLQNEVETLTNSGEDKDELIAQKNAQISNLQASIVQLQQTNQLNTQTITSLNNQINSLNSQISDMSTQIQNNSANVTALNNKIAELEKSVAYYEQYIANLENDNQVVVTFEFDNSVYNIQIISKNSTVSVVDPTSTDYVIFNYWTVDGQQIDLSTYEFAKNKKVVANVTYKYNVKFMVDETEYNSQIVAKNSYPTLPNNPIKDGYEFDYWTSDGVTQVDPTNFEISQNTTFIAKFTQLFTVQFIFDNEIVNTQLVRSGSVAKEFSLDEDKSNKLLGWTIYGEDVDINNYPIYSNVIFNANFLTRTFVKTQFNIQTKGSCVFNIYDNVYCYVDSEYKFYIWNKETQIWSALNWDYSIFGGNFDPSRIWTDGNNYYSSYPKSGGNCDLMFNKETGNWETIDSWNGFKQFSGSRVWTDGKNVYLNFSYILNIETRTWESIEWTGVPTLTTVASNIWTDGNNFYFSSGSNQYIINFKTHSLSEISWSGLTSFYASYIWTDGNNYYYSDGSNQYILDAATRTWSNIAWSGLTSFYASNIWTDGNNFYYCDPSYSQYFIVYI